MGFNPEVQVHTEDPSPICILKNISSHFRSYAFIWSASGTNWCSPPRSALTSLSLWTAWTYSPFWPKTARPRPPPTTCCPSSVTTAPLAVSSSHWGKWIDKNINNVTVRKKDGQRERETKWERWSKRVTYRERYTKTDRDTCREKERHCVCDRETEWERWSPKHRVREREKVEKWKWHQWEILSHYQLYSQFTV